MKHTSLPEHENIVSRTSCSIPCAPSFSVGLSIRRWTMFFHSDDEVDVIGDCRVHRLWDDFQDQSRVILNWTYRIQDKDSFKKVYQSYHQEKSWYWRGSLENDWERIVSKRSSLCCMLFNVVYDIIFPSDRKPNVIDSMIHVRYDARLDHLTMDDHHLHRLDEILLPVRARNRFRLILRIAQSRRVVTQQERTILFYAVRDEIYNGNTYLTVWRRSLRDQSLIMLYSPAYSSWQSILSLKTIYPYNTYCTCNTTSLHEQVFTEASSDPVSTGYELSYWMFWCADGKRVNFRVFCWMKVCNRVLTWSVEVGMNLDRFYHVQTKI